MSRVRNHAPRCDPTARQNLFLARGPLRQGGSRVDRRKMGNNTRQVLPAVFWGSSRGEEGESVLPMQLREVFLYLSLQGC